jgi:hypothetical protein
MALAPEARALRPSPGLESLALILRGALAHRRHGQAAHCRSAYCRRHRYHALLLTAPSLPALPAQPGFGWEGIAVVQAVLIMSRSVAQTAPAHRQDLVGTHDVQACRCKSRQACFLTSHG